MVRSASVAHENQATGTVSSGTSVAPDGEVLDDRIRQQRVGELGHGGVVEPVLDLEFEVLALTDVAYPDDAEPAKRAHYRLTLGVQDLGLEHDVDDHAGHGYS